MAPITFIQRGTLACVLFFATATRKSFKGPPREGKFLQQPNSNTDSKPHTTLRFLPPQNSTLGVQKFQLAELYKKS